VTEAVKIFLISVVAAAIGSVAAQYLVNKNRTVRRFVGGI